MFDSKAPALSATDPPAESRPAAGSQTVAGGRGWRGAATLLRGPLGPLVSGQCLGQFADGLTQIAFAQLVLFDVAHGATPARIAAVLAVTLLPFSVVGPLAGVLIDRWDRRRTLIAISVLRAALTVGAIATVFAQSTVAAYVGVLVLLSSSRFVLAAKGAALPRTVPRRELVTGNAVSSVAGMSSAFLGAVSGSLLVGHSTAAGFAIAGILYLAAALAFTRLPDVGGRQPAEVLSQIRRLATELADGMRVAAGSAAVRWPLAAVVGHRLLLGAGFVILVLVADARYRLEISGYGVALAATGVAAFAGSLLAPPLARRYSAPVLVPIAFLPAAAAAYVAGLFGSLVVLVCCISVVAFAFQILKITVDALVGGNTPDALRGRVFAVYDVLYNVAFVAAGLLMVPLWRIDRERSLLWLLAAGFALGWLLIGMAILGWRRKGKSAGQGRRIQPARRRLSWLAAALASGALPALAFPATAWWWLAWIALIPLILTVRAAPSCAEGGLRAWCGAAGLVLATQHWLLPSTGPFLLLYAAAVGALWWPWGWATHWLLSGRPSTARTLAAVLVLPSAWVVAEVARSWPSLGGPWTPLGASQWNQPVMLASASIGGVWLTSMLIVAVNTTLATALCHRDTLGRTATFSVAVGCAAAGPAWFALAPQALTDGLTRVALVQPGDVVDSTQRRVAGEAITAGLAGQQLDLVVWGESSIGVDLPSHPAVLGGLVELSQRVGADLLVNVDALRPGGAVAKSSVLIGPAGTLGEYRKTRLVPFGEYVPLRNVLGPIARHTQAAESDRARGPGPAVLHTGALTIGPLISFEATFSDLPRRQVELGAQLLAYQSSTSSFQGSWAQAQLASQVAVHAVEVGRPAVHAALSGVSSAFDARGRQLAWYSATERGAVVVRVPLTSATTVYQRIGEWVPALAVCVLAGAAAAATVRSRRRRTISGAGTCAR